jgi:hypothetical protein
LWETFSNVEVCDQNKQLAFNTNDTMLTDTDPGAFIILVLVAVAVGGPFLLGCVYIICYIFLQPQQPTLVAPVHAPTHITNKLQLAKLQPDTRVGCPDGLCYLPMFIQSCYTQITYRLGHFPSILALTTIPKSYRRKARGKLEIIGDGIAHFEPDRSASSFYDVLDF